MADILTIREAVARAKNEGLPISEYTLRAWVKSGSIPVRRMGRKIFIYFPNLVSFLRCDGVADNHSSIVAERGVRRVEVR